MPRFRPLLAGIAAAVLCASPGLAWDSDNWANVTHATHSYLTEHAVGSLQAGFPEAWAYRAVIIEGANTELHELPVSGTAYGIDLEAKRVEHRGTNEGTADIRGWWDDALAAYRAGNKEQAYFYVGVILHMVEDMGVPAHAHRIYHQGTASEFDNFELMGLLKWEPSFAAINRADPNYDEPWRYYDFQREWTLADSPTYLDTDTFSKTWLTASREERALLSNRQGRTAVLATWTLRSALEAFAR